MTLKEIQSTLIDFFATHLQINQVSIYDNKGFMADRSKAYMIANIEYLDSNINGKTRNDRFQITLADLLTPSSGNAFEIYNTANEIAEDFFTYLQNHDDFIYNRSASLQKFKEDDGDSIAGLTFTITLSTIRTQNICAIPFKGSAIITDGFPYPYPIAFL